jgi:hypothetical protein
MAGGLVPAELSVEIPPQSVHGRDNAIQVTLDGDDSFRSAYLMK